MTFIPDIEKMIEKRDVSEAENRSILRQAKRHFDEEKLKINNNFLEETKQIVDLARKRLTDESNFEDLINDNDFTSKMLPYLDEIHLSKEFLQKFRDAFSDSFHMEFLEVPKISISWYQSNTARLDTLENNHKGLEETIPYSDLIKMWLSPGENYLFGLVFENDSIEIGFDHKTDDWFILEIESLNDGEYIIHHSPPTDRFPNYPELVKFIEKNSFPHS